MAKNTNTATAKVEETKPVEVKVDVPQETKPIVPSAEELIKKYGTKSAAIRALYAEKKTVSEIAKILDIKYQHVRNVLQQPLGAKLPTSEEVAKSLKEHEAPKPTDDNNNKKDEGSADRKVA